MKKIVLALIACVFSGQLLAAAPKGPLDPIDVDITDQESLQRGLTLFANYCFGCHSLEHARYERAAVDLGIPNEIFEENLIFSDAKIGQLMTNAMPKDQAASWFGSAPPDLTLSARLRGPEWIYSYMRAFYVDPKRPYGVNNVVFKDVGMPHVLAELQGVCAEAPAIGSDPEVDPLSGKIVKSSTCQEFVSEGSMSPEQYDEAIYDLVNFLEYVGEPSRIQSVELGRMVLIFLAFLFVFVYYLNKEYWRDIH